MKLEKKFFNSFFYPFVISVTLCSLLVTIFLGSFTNTYYDEEKLKAFEAAADI